MADFLIGLGYVAAAGLAFGYLVYLFAVREGNRRKYAPTDNAGAEEGASADRLKEAE